MSLLIHIIMTSRSWFGENLNCPRLSPFNLLTKLNVNVYLQVNFFFLLFVSCCCYWCCCCFVSVLVSYAEKTSLSLCWARGVCWGITHLSWTNKVPTAIPGLFTGYAPSTLTLPLISLCFLSRVSLSIFFVLVFSQDLSSTCWLWD